MQQRAPEWTDHNVSDPGVTLIETFAVSADRARTLTHRTDRTPGSSARSRARRASFGFPDRDA